jgi:cytochrome P450
MLPPRFCDKPIELDGITIPAKEMVIFCIASANRDPSIIQDGDTFDITRERSNHLSFGHGPHRCLGAELGRIETGEGIAAFLRRFPNARLAVPPGQITWRPTTFLRRVDSLPVLVDATA